MSALSSPRDRWAEAKGAADPPSRLYPSPKNKMEIAPDVSNERPEAHRVCGTPCSPYVVRRTPRALLRPPPSPPVPRDPRDPAKQADDPLLRPLSTRD